MKNETMNQPIPQTNTQEEFNQHKSEKMNPLLIPVIFLLVVSTFLACIVFSNKLYYDSYDYTMEQLTYVNGFISYTNSELSQMNTEMSLLEKKIAKMESIDNPTLFQKDEISSLRTEREILNTKITQTKQDLEKAKEKANSLAQKAAKMMGF